MTIAQALARATKKLQRKSIASARLDAEVLLSFILKKPREHLLAHSEKTLSPAEQKKYSILLGRRAKHEPVAYLTGAKEFYGLNIIVNKNVLIPRPETELLVDEVIGLVRAAKPLNLTILDVGTGSGAIALALAKNLSQVKILALEASPQALFLAKKNAQALRLKISFLKSDLLEKIKPELIKGAVIAANLPYLDKGETKNFSRATKRGLKFEPPSALYAAKRGTALYEQLFKQIKSKKEKPRFLIAEIGSYHFQKFVRLAKTYFPESEIKIKKDLAGRPRILIIKFKD